MVVKELIDKLSELNPDLLIAYSYDGERAEVCDPLKSVIVEPVSLFWAKNADGGESLQYEDVDGHGDTPVSVAVIY